MSKQLGKGGAVSSAGAQDHSSFAQSGHNSLCYPEPLLRQKAEGRPLPVEHLGPLKAPTEAIAALTAAPIEIAFQSVLATSSLATQHLVNVETLAGLAPLSLFLITIAASGERKSACDRLATKSVHDWEEESYPAYLKALTDFEREKEVYDINHRLTSKAKADNQTVIEADWPEAPEPPVLPRKLLSDITFEGVLRHLEDGDPSIAIFADEGGQFFGGHGMGKDNQLKTAAGLSKIWDAAPLNRTRAGSSQMTFRHRRGALHLMIQPAIAENVLRNEVLRDQGFLSRTLLAWPETQIGRRLIVLSDEEQAKLSAARHALGAFQSRIGTLLRLEAATKSVPLEVSPQLLPLDHEAQALLVRFANQIEVAQKPEGPLSHITGFASKAAEQAARIAGVLTVVESECASEVSAQTMGNAIQIASWYVSEAERLLDAGDADSLLQKAQILLDWLHTKQSFEPFDKRRIVRYGPSSIRDTKLVSQLISILVQTRHIRPLGPDVLAEGNTTREAWGLIDYA